MGIPKTYIATYEPNLVERGWNARIEGVDDCRTHAPTLALAQEQIRSALRWRLRDVPSTPLIEDRLPPRIAMVTKRAKRAQREADRAKARAQLEVANAARELAKLGVSRRDSAALLGLSHQRVQQLVAGRRPARVGTPIGTPRGEIGADSA